MSDYCIFLVGFDCAFLEFELFDIRVSKGDTISDTAVAYGSIIIIQSQFVKS